MEPYKEECRLCSSLHATNGFISMLPNQSLQFLFHFYAYSSKCSQVSNLDALFCWNAKIEYQAIVVLKCGKTMHSSQICGFLDIRKGCRDRVPFGYAKYKS